MINFKANYINTVPIKTLNTTNNVYYSKAANFVEFDIKNSNDIAVINDVACLWRDNSFADNIAYDVNNANKGYFK